MTLTQKPVASTATQQIVAEIAKESAVVAELEKAKEAGTAEIKATDTKIREVGVQYKAKVCCMSQCVVKWIMKILTQKYNRAD